MGKAKKTRAELAQEKAVIAEQIKQLHLSVMGFCKGRPPSQLLTAITLLRLITKILFQKRDCYLAAQRDR